MLSRAHKALYFRLTHYPMRLNALRHRLLRPGRGPQRVQLGSGKNYFDDWINVDANFITAKIDIWADVGAKLPFRDGTVGAFYSHHVIEHLADSNLPFHFAELFRCLKKGGVIRIGGPNADSAARKFLEDDKAWFGDFPDKRDSIGGRFANFILCRGEHLAILSASYLTELAAAAGFERITIRRPTEDTGYPAVFDTSCLRAESESDPDTPHTLIMEACKPG